MVMDGIDAIRTYINRIVSGDDRCLGMKVLLLDASTTQTISCVYTQSEILSREVYLVSRLDDASQNPNVGGVTTSRKNKKKEMSHLKAVCFLRPTEINAGLMVKELAHPRFAEYHVFFSGIVPSGLLRLIAENDEHELVRQVQEFYGDFLPINEDLLTLNCRNTLLLHQTSSSSARHYQQDEQTAHIYERNLSGLESILLSLKRQPSTIRYQASSILAHKVSHDLQDRILSDQIFHFPQNRQRTALLILDRMDDVVTPLLSQWTYQAMVHELLGLNNNRVSLEGAPNVPEDLREVVLSSSSSSGGEGVASDSFFHRHRYSNFGELGEAIKHMLDDYKQQQSRHADVSKLNSIDDMQRFMEKFPEIRSKSHVVSKHVAIMGELARLVEVCDLMDVSQFEQELACNDDHGRHVRELMEKLGSAKVKIPDKLRLGLLYALRYEDSGNLGTVKEEMVKGGVDEEMVTGLVEAILRYGGREVRGPGLYGETAGKNKKKDGANFLKMTKSLLTSVQGVSNVYAQHVPVLMDTIQALVKGRLRADSHPFVKPGKSSNSTNDDDASKGKGKGKGPAASASSSASASDACPPNEIIVFMVGGVTYEEATKVAEFNASNPQKLRVILAGSTVHNSTSFLEELRAL